MRGAKDASARGELVPDQVFVAIELVAQEVQAPPQLLACLFDALRAPARLRLAGLQQRMVVGGMKGVVAVVLEEPHLCASCESSGIKRGSGYSSSRYSLMMWSSRR
jgi:hypothetical protein